MCTLHHRYTHCSSAVSWLITRSILYSIKKKKTGKKSTAIKTIKQFLKPQIHHCSMPLIRVYLSDIKSFFVLTQGCEAFVIE